MGVLSKRGNVYAGNRKVYSKPLTLRLGLKERVNSIL